jgi:hypothetical protein
MPDINELQQVIAELGCVFKTAATKVKQVQYPSVASVDDPPEIAATKALPGTEPTKSGEFWNISERPYDDSGPWVPVSNQGCNILAGGGETWLATHGTLTFWNDGRKVEGDPQPGCVAGDYASGRGSYAPDGTKGYVLDQQNSKGLRLYAPDHSITAEYPDAMPRGNSVCVVNATQALFVIWNTGQIATVGGLPVPQVYPGPVGWPNAVFAAGRWWIAYQATPNFITILHPFDDLTVGWKIPNTPPAFYLKARAFGDSIVVVIAKTQGDTPAETFTFDAAHPPKLELAPPTPVDPPNPGAPPSKPIVTGATIPTVVAPGRKIIRVLFKGHNLRTGDFNPCPGDWEVIDDGTNASDAIVWPPTDPPTYKPVLVTFNSTQGDSLKTHMQGMFGGGNNPHDSLPSAIENCAIQWQKDHALPAVMVRYCDGAFPPGFFATFNKGDVVGIQAYCDPAVDDNAAALVRIESWIQQVPNGVDVMLVRGFDVKYWPQSLPIKDRVQRMLDFQVGLSELERKYTQITYSALFCWGRWAVHPVNTSIIIDGGGYYFQESNDFAWNQWANL